MSTNDRVFVMTTPGKGRPDEVLIEAVRTPGMPVAMAGTGPLPKIAETFDELCLRACEKVSFAVDRFANLMSDARLESADVKIGVKFTAEGKIIVASSSAEGSIEIALKFARQPTTPKAKS